MSTPTGGELRSEVHVPKDAEDGLRVVVLLHGRGSDRTDLMSLQPSLPAEWAVVAPDAPFAAEPWGYGPGRAWYRYLGRNRPEAESFSASLASIERLLDELPRLIGHEPGDVVLGGFSQGGTVSLAYALTHPERSLSILNFSGFLADHPAVKAERATVKSSRIFWGHGTRDPAIPFQLAIEGRELLDNAGADLEARDYPIAHGISPDELRDAVTWLRSGTGT